MSVAAEESCVDAPEALRNGVMERILSSETAGKAKDAKGSRVVRAILTRYLPIAACLAVMLISLPWIVNYYSGQFGSGGSSSAPAPTMQQLMVQPDQDEARNTAEAMTGGGDMASFSAEIDAPYGSATDNSGAMPEESMAMESRIAVAMPDMQESGDTGTRVNRDSGDPLIQTPELWDASMHVDDSGKALEAEDAGLPWHSEIWRNIEGFEDAYAWVEITGDLPIILSRQEPKPLPDGLPFEVYYRVPRSVVEELVKESEARDGIEILMNNADSDFAVVLWTGH